MHKDTCSGDRGFHLVADLSPFEVSKCVPTWQPEAGVWASIPYVCAHSCWQWQALSLWEAVPEKRGWNRNLVWSGGCAVVVLASGPEPQALLNLMSPLWPEVRKSMCLLLKGRASVSYGPQVSPTGFPTKGARLLGDGHEDWVNPSLFGGGVGDPWACDSPSSLQCPLLGVWIPTRLFLIQSYQTPCGSFLQPWLQKSYSASSHSISARVILYVLVIWCVHEGT